MKVVPPRCIALVVWGKVFSWKGGIHVEANGPTTETNAPQRDDFESLEQETDKLLNGIFEGDNVSQEFTQQLKTVIMTYLENDSLIQVDVENRDDDSISCSVFSDDGVHKFLYESEEEWGGMFFGRDELEHAFDVLSEMELEMEANTEIPIQH
jgi:hypothetical protein